MREIDYLTEVVEMLILEVRGLRNFIERKGFSIETIYDVAECLEPAEAKRWILLVEKIINIESLVEAFSNFISHEAMAEVIKQALAQQNDKEEEEKDWRDKYT
jgi:hypothetical protein